MKFESIACFLCCSLLPSSTSQQHGSRRRRRRRKLFWRVRRAATARTNAANLGVLGGSTRRGDTDHTKSTATVASTDTLHDSPRMSSFCKADYSAGRASTPVGARRDKSCEARGPIDDEHTQPSPAILELLGKASAWSRRPQVRPWDAACGWAGRWHGWLRTPPTMDETSSFSKSELEPRHGRARSVHRRAISLTLAGPPSR